MIRVIIERMAKEEWELELPVLLLDLRAKAMPQPGYVSGETLVAEDNPLLYIVISTWRSGELWQAWASSTERGAIAAQMEPLLSAPEKTTILNFIEEHGR